MKISSPIASGNGAYIVHKLLSENINNYTVCPYNPLWTLLPPRLCKTIKYPDADIIHTTPDHPIWLNRTSKQVIITFHNYMLDAVMAQKASSFQRFYYVNALKKYTLLSINNAQTITAVSNFTANLVKKDLGLKQDIEVIYNGVDTCKFSPKKRVKSNGKINVLFVGNFTFRKGTHLLSKIQNKVESNIDIYYTRGLRKNYISSVDNLIDVGYVLHSEMPALYNNADILLFPTYREGFGLAVAEAMSCGLPIVASDCSSIPELLDDSKGGFLCDIDDVDGFAEKLNFLADAPELRLEMGEYNRTKVEEKFTLGEMVKRYEALFEKVLTR